jgi:hypothetical protein
MANGFDRRGALIGVGLLILFILVGWALLSHVSIEITLPAAGTAPK